MRLTKATRAITDCVEGTPLRHAYASLLMATGESTKVGSEWMGHTDAAMTLNVHGRLFPEPEDLTRAGVGRAFGVMSAGCAPDVPSQPEG